MNSIKPPFLSPEAEARIDAAIEAAFADPALVVKPVAKFVGFVVGAAWLFKSSLQSASEMNPSAIQRPKQCFTRDYQQAQRIGELTAGLLCEACGLPGLDVEPKASAAEQAEPGNG